MRLFGSLRELVAIFWREDGQEISLDANSATTYTANRAMQLPPGDIDSTLVGEANTQTLTNKTIDGDNNTVQDLPVTAIKTVIGDANKVILRDGSGVPTSALLVNANVSASAAIDATKVGNGDVDNTELSLLNGLTGSIVTPTSTNTLTNKTIDGDNNTVQDLALTSLKTDLAGADKVLGRDTSGIVQNRNDIPNNAPMVTTTSTQQLTNKDIDGGTASNALRQTLPKNTTTNLAALTRKQATIAYDTTLNQVVIDDGSAFSPITGASSGFPLANIRALEGAGTTTLTSADSRIQRFNISTDRTCVMPSTGIVAGDVWKIVNHRAAILTIQASDTTTVVKSWGTDVMMVARVSTPTTGTDWSILDHTVLYGRTWQSDTPATGSFGTISNSSFQWMRPSVDTMIYRVSFTTGTPAGTVAAVALPLSLNIDMSKLPGDGRNFVGLVETVISGGAVAFPVNSSAVAIARSADTTAVYFATTVNPGNPMYTPQNANSMINASGDTWQFTATLPITEWSET